MPKIIITEDSIQEVLKIIDTWEGKLTWSSLCEKVAVALGKDKVERQSLAAYEVIQSSYSRRKVELRESKDSTVQVEKDVTNEYLKNKVKELEAEVSRLTTVNNRFKERFILWQYNAYINGIRVSRLDDVPEVLNKPLTAVNRAK
ncbi:MULTISPECIES: hypothetical protein [Pseudoalteromonas]|uniref:Uncharacterized protein n=1 Tax=Pseudoalteromonas espejiana TaxID=28107 RepID=A0A510XQB4_9GAMM|nr:MULTISPECIES: hypothetical protein [Pseudoalteromonas]ASM48648.1 hypothetical protein PESP_a0391 [Pseudoalteromonas espejiana DSM 9414]MBE3672438.1 hypothetical protein [Pseudoalteromonas distincta KMM 3548]GEK53213.1 hypothetical protein PES01_00580 [Pseudoalteromonas espejiana]